MNCHRLIPNLRLHPMSGEPVEVGYECVDCDFEDDGQWLKAETGEDVYVVLDAISQRTYRLRWYA